MSADLTLRSLGASSAKYGACEVCSGHCSEVWLLSDGRHTQTFGHRECLEEVAKAAAPAVPSTEEAPRG